MVERGLERELTSEFKKMKMQKEKDAYLMTLKFGAKSDWETGTLTPWELLIRVKVIQSHWNPILLHLILTEMGRGLEREVFFTL